MKLDMKDIVNLIIALATITTAVSSCMKTAKIEVSVNKTDKTINSMVEGAR